MSDLERGDESNVLLCQTAKCRKDNKINAFLMAALSYYFSSSFSSTHKMTLLCPLFVVPERLNEDAQLK